MVKDWSMFFAGAFCGSLFMLFFIVMLLRWALRNQDLLTGLVREIYHVDLLPFICRIEGLLNLSSIELQLNTRHVQTYIELAQKEIKKLKEQVTAAVKKYEGYNDRTGKSGIERWFRS